MSRSEDADAVSTGSPQETKPGPRDERGVLSGRILGVARQEFSTRGFAGTSVRAVARGAGVDPALVYHYYGSKDGLLRACIEPPPTMLERIAAAWGAPREQLGAALVRVTLANWTDPDSSSFLRTLLLTAAHHDQTRERLREVVSRQLMGPAHIGVGEEDSRARASLIASQLLGLGLTRYVWRVEPLAGMEDEDVVAAVAPAIQRYVDGDLRE
jgi:AcrR family transcriptional regulator